MHPNSFLTSEQVEKIKRLYATGFYTQYRLGKMFGVNQSEISRIVNKKRWHTVKSFGMVLATR